MRQGCRRRGCPRPRRRAAAILSTISNPDVTVPNTVYPSGSGRLESPWTRKNWPPLPFSGSAVRAIARVPRGYAPSFGAFSTPNPYPGFPEPVPVGSPHWSTLSVSEVVRRWHGELSQ